MRLVKEVRIIVYHMTNYEVFIFGAAFQRHVSVILRVAHGIRGETISRLSDASTDTTARPDNVAIDSTARQHGTTV